VRFAQAYSYQRLLVVTSPFHPLRAFMAMVTAALREYPSLKLYSVPGAPQPWDEVVPPTPKASSAAPGLN
jgi:hypothetical protein